MSTTPQKHVCLLAVLCLSVYGFSGALPAADKVAVRSATDQIPRIVLSWVQDASEGQGNELFSRFNLYRKIDSNAPYPKYPLNSKPIEMAATCQALMAIINPESGREWDLIAEGLRLDENDPRYDPCDIPGLPKNSPRYQRLERLAWPRWKIAQAIGQAYEDRNVQGGDTYYYELRGLDGNMGETVLASNIKVKAGAPTRPLAPSGLAADAGDSRVLLYWEGPNEAAGFNVYRSENPNDQNSQLVNDESLTSYVREDLEGKALDPKNDKKVFQGFLDFQRWDPSGEPEPHYEANDQPIDGPRNQKSYYYRVAAVDLLGNEGSHSGEASATPMDLTPPAVPSAVSVTADNEKGTIEVRWDAALRDIDGHREVPEVNGYRVFRRGVKGGPDENPVLVSGSKLIPHPGAKQLVVSFLDTDSALRPQYGEKEFFYEIECEDAAGHKGARSAAVGSHLKDITAPATPQGLAASGFEDHIHLKWPPSNEPDMDGYGIYRSICHNGLWLCLDPSIPGCDPPDDTWEFLGYVSQLEALADGEGRFDDFTLPKGSPLCYAYLIKALDEAQNRSGSWLPDPSKETIICQRLRDKTPPEPAIISALLARDGHVRVEWIGAPIQDIWAYQVYRSESENGPYQWVGGETVEKPPVPLSQPYQPPSLVGCDKVPAVSHEGMSAGGIDDFSAAPKKVYWYKVVGIDQVGNEADLGKAVPISTFTFTTLAPQGPAITSVTQVSSPCALKVGWTPSFDSTNHIGFALFRSDGGGFLQIGPLLSGTSEYVDRAVVKGKTYTYRVAILDKDGNLSQLSPTKSGTPN